MFTQSEFDATSARKIALHLREHCSSDFAAEVNRFTQTQTHRFLPFSLYHTIKHNAVCLLVCIILLNVMQFLSFILYHTIKRIAVSVFYFAPYY